MKKNTIKVLSFLGGLSIAAVVVGVTIYNNPSIKNEIENQLTTVLKATRALVDAYNNLSSKSRVATSFIKTDSSDKAPDAEAKEQEARVQANSQWDEVELQIERKSQKLSLVKPRLAQ